MPDGQLQHEPRHPPLARIIAWRLAEHEQRSRSPLRYELLARWIRIQWPCVLPDAIGKLVCDLAAAGMIEADPPGWRMRSAGSRARAARDHSRGWEP